MSENDLRKLFQAAGHTGPERDLTDRILARVAVTRIADPTPVQPLIGKRAWAGIAGTALLVLAIAAGLSGAPAATPTVPYAQPLIDWLGALRLPEGQWPQWVIGASGLALFFAALVRKAERNVPA